jgi:pyruvate,orthophosphate dikinase
MGEDISELTSKVKALKEFNPMLGHRGCRLAITYPEIYEMQAKAIAEAMIEIINLGQKAQVEIMIPLVATEKELGILRELVEKTVNEAQSQSGVEFSYSVGTMIELPRAAIIADEIAQHADFFSFGTNDLTQTCLGLSRDDSGRFLDTYVKKEIMAKDPFVSIDQKGVGALVKMACEKGLSVKKGMKLGVCGEHGGDPDSIDFFHKVGLNYVSCSPYRVPVARLAAAQSAIRGTVSH